MARPSGRWRWPPRPARGYARMDWAVLDWNEPAKAFYRRLGARHNVTWEPWRLDGEALAALDA